MTLPQHMMLSSPSTNYNPPFVPTDITGCTLWLDAADSATITESSGLVSQWDDKSTNAYALTATTTQRPTTGTRTINSLNVLDFNGTSNRLRRDSSPINNASNGRWTLFVVAEADSVAALSHLVEGDDGSDFRVAQYLRIDAGGAPRVIGFNGIVQDATTAISTATPYLFRSVNTGSAIEVFVDGVSDGATSGTSSAYSAAAKLSIGSFPDFAAVDIQFWDGKIAEVVCYDSSLSAGDITSVEDYLSAKWGTA